MLKVSSVTKHFGATATLHDVSLSVSDGEVVSLVGPSGCGKSTLLRIIAGLDRDYTGHISVAGETITRPSAQVGVVFQEPRLMPWLTVGANIAFGSEALAAGSSVVCQAAAQVGLGDFLEALPRQLSGGMAQRCSIARALITNPRLLLLDEPFSALDAFTRMGLQDLLLNLVRTRGTTMLLVTHDIDEALYLSDRVIVLGPRPSGPIAEVAGVRDRKSAAMSTLRAQILDALDHTENQRVGLAAD